MPVLESIKSFFNKIKQFKNDLIGKLSEKQKFMIVELFLVSMGLLVFILRCLSIMELWNTPTFYVFNTYIKEEEELGKIGVLHTSNIISIFVAISLMLRLRNSFINCTVIVMLPGIAMLCVGDMIIFFMLLGQGGISLNTLSIHLPTTIVGIYLILRMKERINLENFAISVLVINIWGYIVDTPRFFNVLLSQGGIALFVTLAWWGIISILCIKFKLYRGLECPPVYKIKDEFIDL